jgi:transketolase
MEQLYSREVYGKTLVELGRKDPRIIVVDADLSGSTKTILFAREFPERFFNFGVAEQNMMTAAAGMARCSKIVFASTFAMFASARVLDQVRNTICYNNSSVKIVATHAGLTVGEDGASHQALEDIAIMRVLPNMRVIVPCDAWETRAAVIVAYQTPGPFYIRLGRAKSVTIDKRPEFVLGKGYLLKEGKDIAIIACGIMVQEALAASAVLADQGISSSVANIHTIKPLDEELIIRLAQTHKALLVCEEHQAAGGLYSAICEVLARKSPARVDYVAVENKFGQSGLPEELLEFYALNAAGIVKKAKILLEA